MTNEELEATLTQLQQQVEFLTQALAGTGDTADRRRGSHASGQLDGSELI